MSVETRHAVEADLVAFLAEHTGHEFTAEQDIFAEGGVTSLFAMQLVVHLEKTYGIRIGGPDLKFMNFRSVAAMSALVGRLGAPQ